MSIRWAAWVAMAVLSALGLFGRSMAAEADAPPRYDWQVGQTFAYDAKIVVDLPDRVETYQGTIQYTVNSVEADNRRVTYQGGLAKSTKSKSSGRPGFGPMFRPPGPPPSPFSRSNFRGSEQTTNEITISSQGAVVGMKGDSQLPFLIGNVSLLPFEPLPDAVQPQWQVATGAAITEKDERRDMRPWFGPFDPFGRGEREETVQAASESMSYEITGTKGPVVSVAKSYELKSPAAKEGEAGFVLAGSGVWEFHRKLNVSESLRMDLKLLVEKNNQQTTVPVTIEYRRLTDEELAKVQAEREERLAELRRRTEEMARLEAEKKRLAETPLTEEEKAAALAALGGSDTAAWIETLDDLAKRDPKDPDSEIAAAVERLLNHAERSVREAAHRALLRWSLEYRPRGDLDRQYKGPGGVESTARIVAADAPLFVGQIVQLRDRNRWVPADILEVNSDGRVKVHPRGWQTTAWDKVVTRDDIQLAPEHLFQPNQVPDQSPVGNLRVWTDATGTHKIEAAYLGVADGAVQLKRKDGREISVPLDRLSPEDQQHVQQKQNAAKLPPNPFD